MEKTEKTLEEMASAILKIDSLLVEKVENYKIVEELIFLQEKIQVLKNAIL